MKVARALVIAAAGTAVSGPVTSAVWHDGEGLPEMADLRRGELPVRDRKASQR